MNTKDFHNFENDKIYNRNIPSQPLQMYLDARAVPTKYSLFPIVDPHKPTTVQSIQYPLFNQQTMFNPGKNGPYSGFANNVNHESELRNQIFALQRCDQREYVPSSTSSLYVPYKPTPVEATPASQSLMFQPDTFCQNQNQKGDKKLFNNSSRIKINQ